MNDRKRPQQPDAEHLVRSSPFDDLKNALAAVAAEARRHAGTARGQEASERLMYILARPAHRIARDALERHLERGAINCDDIASVAAKGLVELHHFLVSRKRDLVTRKRGIIPVMRALTILTQRTARCYVQEKYGRPDAPEQT